VVVGARVPSLLGLVTSSVPPLPDLYPPCPSSRCSPAAALCWVPWPGRAPARALTTDLPIRLALTPVAFS